MRTIPGKALLAALLVGSACAHAQFPVQDMDSRSLGLGYTFALRGQDITEAQVASNEVIHQIDLAYAPIPYLSLHGSLGVDRLTVAPYNRTRFRGDYGFSPSFGAALYSPALADGLLRGTGGAGVRSLDSEDDRGYRYTASATTAFLGLIVSPTVFLDAALGARLLLVDGDMKAPGSAEDRIFANSNTGRLYLSLTLKTPFERAFLNVDMDFSPETDSDWSEGPREAALGVSFGTLLGWRGKSRPAPEKPVYFPAYPEMKERQKKMAEEIE